MSTAPLTPIETILQNRAKLSKLPPEQQQRFADFIYRKFIQPKMDAANVPPEYALRAKKQFTDKLLTGEFRRMDDSPTRDDRKKAGQPVGMMGSLAKGSLEGLANMASAGAKLTKLPLGGGPEAASAYRSSEASLRDAAEAAGSGSKEYSEKHPYKAGAAEMVGEAAPAVPFAMATGGAMGAAGASALPTAMAEGAVGMQSLDPGLKGAVVGAAIPPILRGVGKGISKVVGPTIAKYGAAAAQRATNVGTKATSILGDEFNQALEAKAQAKFQQPFSKLTNEQKTTVFSEQRAEHAAAQRSIDSEAAKAKAAAKAGEVQAKEQARIHAEKAKADAKLEAKVARDRLRDEAKQISQAAAKFRKLTGRAPTDEELAKIREAVKTGKSASAPEPTPASAEVPKPPAEATNAPQTTASGAQLVPGNNPTTADIEALKARHGITSVPSEKVGETVVDRPAQFKAENPQAIAAAQAFTEFAKDPVTGITKVPEGVHGSGFGSNEAALNRVDQVLDKPNADAKLAALKENPTAEGFKGKEADRKAIERATAAAQAAIAKTAIGTENEGISTVEKLASSASTPEDKLVALDKALEYIDANLENGRLLMKSIKAAAKLKKWSTDETLDSTLEIIGRLKKEGKLK